MSQSRLQEPSTIDALIVSCLFVLSIFINEFLQSGACAGMSVDVILFPLDTIKTRLQSEAGFWKSGAFKRIYSGLGSTIIGSAPGGIKYIE